MTDNAEKELRKWARKRNGEPISNHDVVELVFAFADDFDAAHSTTLELIDQGKQERTVICRRITDLEQWKTEAQNTCEDRVTRLIQTEHDMRHSAHMQSHHSDDASFQQRFVWWWGGKLSYIALAVIVTLINIVLNMLWFGKP